MTKIRKTILEYIEEEKKSAKKRGTLGVHLLKWEYFELNKRKSFSSTIAPIYPLGGGFRYVILYTVSRYGYGSGVDREGEREGVGVLRDL